MRRGLSLGALLSVGLIRHVVKTIRIALLRNEANLKGRNTLLDVPLRY